MSEDNGAATEIPEEPGVVPKLEAEGQQILSGHSDIELIDSEVNQIWDMDPGDLNKPLRAVIIEKLRQNRKKFLQTKKERAAKRKPKVQVPDDGISLNDLELKL